MLVVVGGGWEGGATGVGVLSVGVPQFVLKSYGSGMLLLDVGGMFSLLLSLGTSLNVVVLFFFGVGAGCAAACCCFSSLFLFLSAFSLSSLSFFSCFSRSVLRTVSSVNITAYVVLTVDGARAEGGGVGVRVGGDKIDSTVGRAATEARVERAGDDDVSTDRGTCWGMGGA